MTLTCVDLCCGGGGFSEGFKQAGFDIVLGIDNNFLACETFRINHNCKVICQDILEPFDVPFCDVVIASPPCTFFSKINKHDKDETGLKLIKRIKMLIDKINPKYWVIENVPQIIDHFPEFKNYCQYLQANEFGLFHRRKRAFIGNIPKVTNNQKIDAEIIYPTPIANDWHLHKSPKHQNNSCLSDYFGFTPDIEVFRKIMGFPLGYIFVGNKKEQIRQIGNAVCPPVSRAIAEAILK